MSYYELSRAHDIRLIVVRTLLTYLELLGYLEGGTPFYSEYKFQPLMPSPKILETFQGERRAFLANLFRQSRKAKTWFSIDLEKAALNLKESRDRIVRALDFLAEKQMLAVKAQGVRNRYRRLRSCESLPSLAEQTAREVGRVRAAKSGTIASPVGTGCDGAVFLAIAERILRRESLRTVRALRLVFGREPSRRSPRKTGARRLMSPYSPKWKLSAAGILSCKNHKPPPGFCAG